MSALPPLRIDEAILHNGLRVVLCREPRLPLVAVNVWYHVGSKDEAPGKTGFAHLFEHMLFQGSAHVGTNDHFRLVQQAGGVANGSTWYDRTNYYETLPANHLELGLWLESDRMGWLLPAMTDEKLETQRQVVMNERRQRVDNRPYGRAFERLHELLYPEGHPYRSPVIGTMEDIAAAELGDVEDFFLRHYRPDNAVLTLAGDIEPEEALGQVRRYFGEIEPAETPSGDGAPETLDEVAELPRREELGDEVELPRIYLSFRIPAYGSDDWYRGHLLSVALASGRASPLYQEVVHERQLAKDVSLFVLPTELEGTFTAVATARDGIDSAVLERALREHLERASREPLDPEHLDRARNRVITGRLRALERIDRLADLLSGGTTLFDDPRHGLEEVERYEPITAPELVEFAARHLDVDAAATVVVEPA